MATDLQSAKNGTLKSISKYEGYVDEHLALARKRIRLLDLAAGGLGFLALTFAYGLLMALLDRKLEFSSLTRQMLFAVYGIAAAVYIYFMMALPLLRRINPYYAARRIEATLPEAKNSVVNYLDLRRETIPAAFRSAIGLKAAKDLAGADFEEAISARRTSWLGGAVCGLLLALLIVYVMSPQQFVSLMRRAFAPFVEASIATRTRISLVQPENGDLTIPVGRAVSFSVWVEGKIPDAAAPDALQLQYRYSDTDPYESRPLEQGDGPRQWLTTVGAGDVHNGFLYKITGGDTETPEYRVAVHSTPLLSGFDVTYHYRPYLGWRDQLSHDQNIQALRGTEVTVVAHTNRKVKDGQLIITDQNPIAAELVSDDENALRFRLKPLEKDGEYRIGFTAADGDRNVEPLPYKIRVLHDQPPVVELSKPGKDVELPADGMLQLEGSASDDHGLTGMTLQMRLREQALEPKPYRGGKPLLQGDGSLPLVLAYKDLVELAKIKLADGGAVKLQKDDEIEYWLEAKDNYDYPAPNVGASRHFKVKIQQPNQDKKQQQKQQQQQAQKEQQQHEQKQDEQLKEQKKEPQPEQPKQDSAPDQQPQGGEQEKSQSKPDPTKDQNANDQKQQGSDQGQNQNPGERNQSKPDKGQDKSQPDKQQTPDQGQNQNGDTEKQSKQDQARATGNQQAGKPENAKQPDGSSQKQNNLSEEEKKLQDTAERLQKALEKQKERDGAKNQSQNSSQQDPGNKQEQANAAQPQGTKPNPKSGEKQKKSEPGVNDAQNSPPPNENPKDQGVPENAGEKNAAPNKPTKENANDKQSADNKNPNGKNENGGNPSGAKNTPAKEDMSKRGGADGNKDKGDPMKNSAAEKQTPGAENKNPDKKDGSAAPKKSGQPDQQKNASDQKPDGMRKDGTTKEKPADKNSQGSAKEKEVDPKLKDGQREQVAGDPEKPGNEAPAKTSARKPGPQEKNGAPEKQDPKKGASPDGKQKPANNDQNGEVGNRPGEKAKPKPDGQRPGNGDQQVPEKNAGNSPGAEGKGKPDQNAGKQAESDARPEAPRPGQDSAKQQGKGKNGENEGKDPAKNADDKGQQSSSSKGRGGSGGGGSAGDERARNTTPNNTERSGTSEPPEKGEEANKDFQKLAGDLLLPKKIDKGLLKQAGIASQEDYEKFRNAYLEMLKRQASTPEEKEKLAGPQRGNRTMPNQGVRQVGPSEKTNAGSLNRADQGGAPKKFREAFKEFSREISELGNTPEKK